MECFLALSICCPIVKYSPAFILSAISQYVGHRFLSTESIEWFVEDQAFWRSYNSATHPPTPSSFSKLPLFLSPPVCRRSSLLTGEGGGGGRGSISYNREKAWPSIHHAILYAPHMYKLYINWDCFICMSAKPGQIIYYLSNSLRLY